jgi:phage FluMu protein Com
MPITIQCPQCDKKLKVADTSAGKKVRCPACSAVISVPAAEESEPAPEGGITETPKSKIPSPATDDEGTGVTEKPTPKKKVTWDKKQADEEENYGYDDSDDDEEERPRRKKRRRDLDDDDIDVRREVEQPHRGGLILGLGIGSIIVACLCPLICWILASIAVNMANADKQKMERGLMDPAGMSMTTAGQICAYVGSVIGLINCIAGAALRMGDKF